MTFTERLALALKHERHLNAAETSYWCTQFKFLAKDAVARVVELETQFEKQYERAEAAERERDEYWADLCEVKAGTGVVPEALYDEAMKRASKAEAELLTLRQEVVELRSEQAKYDSMRQAYMESRNREVEALKARIAELEQ